MIGSIQFTPQPGGTGGTLTQVPEFPGEHFSVNPEAIGDSSFACKANQISADWFERPGGVWICRAQCAGELSYLLTLTPGYDTVDIHIVLKNESDRLWAQSMVFNHLRASAPSVVDNDCVRHWTRVDGQFKRLIEVPRKFSSRPTVQCYSVEGAPPATDVPFAAVFDATPDVTLEGRLAIQSRDGERLVAITSKPTLFLFQNREFSCIHSSPSFGELQPGETGQARTRMYFVRASLQEWYQRMRLDMAS